MRHRNRGRKLNLSPSHRRALLRALVTALIAHGRIRTTLARAKEARSLADRMISLAKDGSLHARRQALETIYEKVVVRKLFEELAGQFRDRSGGYTRIIKSDCRKGDHASMSLLELTVSREEKKTRVPKKRPKSPAAGGRERGKAGSQLAT